jgi:hypothetical protein
LRRYSSATRQRRQAGTLLREPEALVTTPGYDGSPLVMPRLAQVNPARLNELLTDAWQMQAPDRSSVTSPRPTRCRTEITAKPDDQSTAHERADFRTCAAQTRRSTAE